MRAFIIFIFLLATSLSSFAVNSINNDLLESTLSKNIFGLNDRTTVVASGNEFGTRFIGKLFTPKGTACTASLVGENLILTAAHCIAKEGAPVHGNYKFVLGYDRGSGVAVSSIDKAWWGTLTPENNNWANDWAILRLKERLGAEFGYFGILKRVRWKDPVSLAGYGEKFSVEYLTIHNSCQIRGKDRVGSLLHDCDISKGDSGAPVYSCNGERCYIHALHSAERLAGRTSTAHLDEYSKKDANVAVESWRFFDKVVELNERYNN